MCLNGGSPACNRSALAPSLAAQVGCVRADMSQMARECEICGAALATEGGYVVHQLRVHEQPQDDPVAADETASLPPVPPRRAPAASAFVAIGIAVAVVMAGGVATALI